MKTRYFLIGFLLITTSVEAEIYKWTDRDGNVHFSDKAHPGAETVKLPPVQVYTPPPEVPSAPTSTSSTISTDTTAEPITAYTAVEFVQPVDQATVRDNRGNFMVALKVEPALGPKDTIQLLLDDTPLGKPQNSTVFQLQGINRGAHTLQAQILSPQGEVLKASDSITIYLHRARMGRGG